MEEEKEAQLRAQLDKAQAKGVKNLVLLACACCLNTKP